MDSYDYEYSYIVEQLSEVPTSHKGRHHEKKTQGVLEIQG